MNDDLSTIERVLAKDKEAFRELVEKYQRLVYRVCLNILGIPARAEEASQESFLSAYRSLSSFDSNRGSFSTWLITIARNKSLSAGKKLAPITMENPPEQAAPPRDRPDLAVERTESMELLDRALAELPPDRRRAFVLAEIEGLPQAEIARIEGVATGTVKSRISRAREYLKEALLSFQTRTREHTSPTSNTSIPRS